MSSSGDWPDWRQPPGYTINDFNEIHPAVLGDIAAFLGNNLALMIPNIDQVPGYQAQTPYQAPPIAAEETTTSNTYTNLTTPGPLLTGLPDGKYTITWGASAKISSATTRARMSVSLNGGAVDNTLQAYTSNTGGMTGISFSTSQTLQGQSGGNSIRCMYAQGSSGSATATFGSRWLIAIRISGP